MSVVSSTVSWSLSFYPQPLLNWKRRSTTGFTADMASLNLVGFLCYTTSTAAFLFSPTIIKQYALRHPLAPEPTVRLNDFAFAIHAAVCCAATYSQFWHRLWRFEGESKSISPATRGVIVGSLLSIGTVAFIVWSRGDPDKDPTSWAGIDVVRESSSFESQISWLLQLTLAPRCTHCRM